MDEYTSAETFANRDEPIPTLSFPLPGSEENHAPEPRKRDRLKDSTASKLKEKAQDLSSKDHKHGFSIQDRLFTKLLQQVLPESEVEELGLPQDVRSSKYINRPGFSLPLMTNNFRRFNARIGVVFVFQNRIERILTWRQPSHTLSLLAVCSFVCLDPYLLSVLPSVCALFFILIPAYLVRHPPPPQTVGTSYTLNGPPLAPPRTIKPAGETSKDFFRNMRDLQNCMEDFSTLHDAFIKWVAPPLNFSNEALSSTLFVFLFLGSCALFIFAQVLPWRFILLFVSWSVITVGHPTVREYLLAKHEKEFNEHSSNAQNWLNTWISHDIILDSPPETREVEIFELQNRDRTSLSEEWEPWLFTPTPYDPLSPQRISGDRPKGSRFFEDVQPPGGWEWSDKKWVLDLLSQEWVEGRMVQGVEIETEGERWVSDLVLPEGQDLRFARKGKSKRVEDESGQRQIGDWRRRRWIRSVRRKVSQESDRPS